MTDRDGSRIRGPDRAGIFRKVPYFAICHNTQIQTGFSGFAISYGAIAQGYAAFDCSVSIVAEDGNLGSCRRKGTGCRTEDDVVSLVFQGVVIADDDIGMIIFYTVTGYGIVGADEVVVLAIDQLRVEAIDIVELRRGIVIKSCIPIRRPGAIIIFLLIPFDRIANTYDLGHVGIVHDVTATKGHNLSATGRNGSLQGFA